MSATVNRSRVAHVLRIGGVALVVSVLVCAVGAGSSSPASPNSGPLIEFWDGSSWTQQVSPNPNGTGWFSAVTAMSATDAWAVGKYFGTLSDLPLAAHWDGASWKQVAMPLPRSSEGMDFSGLAALSATDVWAVGWANTIEHRAAEVRTLIEHWNGRTWKIVPSPTPPVTRPHDGAILGSVAVVSPRNVWAVGYYGQTTSYRTLVLHWNGKTWKRIPSPNPAVKRPSAQLNGVAVASPRSVWAVGSYSSPAPSGNRIPHTLVLRWNGRKWRQVPSRNPGGARHFHALYGVAAVERNSVWAVGTYSSGHVPRLPLVEHSNGHSWKSIAAPPGCAYASSHALTDLAPLAPNDIWAAGTSFGEYPCESGGDPSLLTLAEHWDGTAWSVSPSLNPPSSTGANFFGIAAATPSAVWAVGGYH